MSELHPSTGLVLIGYMGSGKSTVGRLLARRLDRPFLDTDQLVERACGRTVAEIFARDGEAAFRAAETLALQEALAQPGAIIATGGGTALFNDALLRAGPPVVHLALGVRQLWNRVKADDQRPLVQAGYEAFRARLAQRQAGYRSFPYQVRAEAAPEVLAEQLARTFFGPRQRVQVEVSAAYPVLIAPGNLSQLGAILSEQLPDATRRCLVVSDPMVMRRYGGIVQQSLIQAGWQPLFCQVPTGEQAKSVGVAQRLYRQAIAGGLDRHAPVLALGGGVVGDLAGFVAATFQRGLPFVQIPTTLLAQIDSSVGGKVAVNLPEGKNLVGAFHQPALVLVDPLTLHTLSDRQLRAGAAELIKYGVILDAPLFERLEVQLPAILERQMAIMPEVIARCCQLKAQIVAQDEREAGDRALLNFGHTVGHAIEAVTGFRTFLHGEAVAMGMRVAGAIAVELGTWQASEQARLMNLIEQAGLPTWLPAMSVETLMQAMGKDKKVRAGRLRFVLPDGMGRARVHHDVPMELIARTIKKSFAQS